MTTADPVRACHSRRSGLLLWRAVWQLNPIDSQPLPILPGCWGSLLREWSLFMAGVAVEFRKSLALKTCPPLNNRALCLCPPLRTCALKSCPPQQPYILICTNTLWSFISKHIIKIYHENGKSIGNKVILGKEISAAPAAAKILAMVFRRLEMALRCLCTKILPPPSICLH